MGLPKRWEMAWLIFSGIAVVYILRVNISVAAQEMRHDLDWSETQKGLVLSAFYWGYSIGMVPASILVQTYGAKWMFGMSVFIPSLLTLLVPIASRHSFALALFIRTIIGLFESANFPAVYHFFPIWIPLSEKTFLIPCTVSGMYFGEIIGFSLSGWLVQYNWQWVFYVFGLVGVSWFPFWCLYAHERPETHPSISDDEVKLIAQGKQVHAYNPLDMESNAVMSPLSQHEVEMVSPSTSAKGIAGASPDNRMMLPEVTVWVTIRRIPWKAFFTNMHSITLFINCWTYGFMNFTLLSEMPSFLTDELHYSLSTAGLLCIFPYLGLFLSTLLFGKLFNHMQAVGYSIDTVRQAAEAIAFIGSAAGLVVAGYLQDNPFACYGFLIISQCMFGATSSGLFCAYSDVAPNHSSTLNSVGNSIAATAGIMGPSIVAYTLQVHPGIQGWRVVFYMTALSAVIAVAFWAKWQTSKLVDVLNTPCGQ